ncbi:hypothetical protein SAMN04489806_2690 [Paramicrobacterium humi]|uniref:Uncharacterized protein n=1 Tax=Paramicrobacterium humi TaxID=640635 RepID=A0A1H4Q2U9_9MICO|nr:DUF6766 family protein [Microbacterium humi]SEC13742.1 hypothetical protein SAMN04489806_2690 [Microbacterium humi]
MKSAFTYHGLSIVLGVVFILILAGQAVSGLSLYNEEQLQDGLQKIGMLDYITSSSFVVDVAENWQSEYLQFLLYIIATIWLVQKGSPESKTADKVGVESDEDQKIGEYTQEDSPRWAKKRDWKLVVYSNSLVIVMAVIFFFSWLVQGVAGHVNYNEEQMKALEAPIPFGEYLLSAEFWNRTLQNWQSEILAVVSMAVLAIFLRQRGSSQSKPVGEPHDATAVGG